MSLEKVRTDDGSVTYYNPLYDDIYHSRSGAKEESIEKFAKQAMLDYFLNQEKLVLFDICFGMGYNSAAFLDILIDNIRNDLDLTIVAFENDIEILENSKEQKDDLFDNYKTIKDVISEAIRTKKEVMKVLILNNKKVNLKFVLKLGDAKEFIKEEKNNIKSDSKANIVFFDAFGPNKHPEMWSEEFFIDIGHLMHENSIFITYSCARHVREKLQKAGLNPMDGAKVGRRAPSTIAYSKKLLEEIG